MMKTFQMLMVWVAASLGCDDAEPISADPQPDARLVDAQIDQTVLDLGADQTVLDQGSILDQAVKDQGTPVLDQGRPLDQGFPPIDQGPVDQAVPDQGIPISNCQGDFDCPTASYCEACATSSCDDCDDCIALCISHRCPTEPEAVCDEERPECVQGESAVVRAGCWVCVDRDTCEPGICIAEGDPVPVRPGMPECCLGLALIGCDHADLAGECAPCVGAVICTQCGNGICGLGENFCNCPADCAPPDGRCTAPIDCADEAWNIRCVGHFGCEDEQCVKVCDFGGCGDGLCDRPGGETIRTCPADCADG